MQGSSITGSPVRQAYGIGHPAALPQNGIAFGINTNELDLDAWYAFLKPSRTSDAATKKRVSPPHHNTPMLMCQWKSLRK